MRVILDTDPGVDDAIAMLWLLALDLKYRADVAAVVAAAGNLQRRATFDNACKLLQLCQRDDLSVGRGSPHTGDTSVHIHGADGMAGMIRTLPDHNKQFDNAPRAADLLTRHLNRDPGDVSVLALGPLTDLAAAEKQQPGTLANAERIIVMGGTFRRGNVTEYAEYNAHFNPVAFNEVLNADADVVIIPLDITQQLHLELAHIEGPEFSKSPHRINKFIYKLCTSMLQHLKENVGEQRFFLHDACVIGYAFYPELFEAVEARVEIESRGQAETLGQTTINPKGSPNATVLRQIDADAVRNKMLEDLNWFSKKLA